MAMTSTLLRPDSGNASGLVPQASLSGALSAAQQTIAIGGADTSGTLSGNTLKRLYFELQVTNALNALLTCAVKLNGSAMTADRLVITTAVHDTVPFRCFGGPAFTALTVVHGWLDLRPDAARLIRTGSLLSWGFAENNTISETALTTLWLPGGFSATDITTVTFDAGAAGGFKAGTSWQVWSQPDPS